MRCYTEGDLIDAYSSDPDYFGIFDIGDADDGETFGDAAPAAAHDDLAGHPERWRYLLVSGHTTAELRAVWDERRIFAEETLALAAELLGMDPARAGSYYQYMVTDGRQPGRRDEGPPDRAVGQRADTGAARHFSYPPASARARCLRAA